MNRVTMLQKKIKTTKTGNYYTIGNPGNATKYIWIVLHGYAQSAKEFAKHFSFLENESRYIIAPEGLSKFYRKGYDGEVVSSWMTKENRLDEISDYVEYLDTILQSEIPKFNSNCKIIVLGYSQGGATACRWLSAGKTKADVLILLSSVFPPDLGIENENKLFENTITHCWIGDKDEWISEIKYNSIAVSVANKGLSIEMIQFSGKHEVREDILEKVTAKAEKLFFFQ